MRPELELLLLFARMCVGAREAERVRALIVQPLDWNYLIHVAYTHGVVPLVYRNLRPVWPQGAPTSGLDTLRDLYHANAKNCLLLTGELLRLISLLKAQDIKAVPFKGPVLAVSAYGDLALRQFTDLDILVQRRDLPRTEKILADHGYRPRRVLTAEEKKAYFEQEHALSFARGDDLVHVDLHWRLAQTYYSFGLDSQSLWDRLKPISIAGTNVESLSPEDSIMFACMHGAKHSWERLGWICDLAELMRAHPIVDWGKILDSARYSAVERIILLGMSLAHELLNAPLPKRIQSKIAADPKVFSLSQRVQEHLFFSRPAEFGPFRRGALFLRTRERLRSRIPYLHYNFRLAVTPNELDFALFSLPRAFNFAYYPLRFLRLAVTYSRELASREYWVKKSRTD